MNESSAPNVLWRGGRFLRWTAVFIVAFNGSLLVWLLVKPGSHGVFTAVDNFGQCLGPLLLLPVCFGWLDRLWRPPEVSGASRVSGNVKQWAPLLLSLGVLTDAIGQSIWTYYQQVLHQQLPFPSWADASYLITYPLLLAGILLLAQSRMVLASQARIALDGLMVMTAAIAFSWYLVLGPTLLQPGESAFAKVVGTAYPLGDLLLIACVIVLSAGLRDASLRPVVLLLTLGLGSIIVADSVFDYQTLHGTYGTGELIDVGWPLGDMLICLAAMTLRARGIGAEATEEEERSGEVPGQATSERRRMWGSMVPYAFVPPVGLLLLYMARVHGDALYEPGVIAASIALVALVLLRQVLAIVENAHLSERIQAKNRELLEANLRLEALATTDPLTNLPNHRALMAALDHELERARRYNRCCSLVFLDLDHFKSVNDSLGHAAGDAALEELGSVVRQALRSVDIVGRWGGEEFLAIFPETDSEGAAEAAEHIRAAVAGHSGWRCGSVRLTCSLGIATYPYDADDQDALMELADRAMYAAKRLGRNQVRAIVDPAVRALTEEMGSARSGDEAALAGTVEALAALVEARDAYTGRHTHEVARLSMQLAMALGLDAAEAHVTGLAARLHDIGKVAVPDAILQKPGRLTPEEWSLIRTHPEVGADVVSRVPALRMLATTIRGHHERWDGRGYPDGLTGMNIPISARIVGVADAYMAMTTDRPYRSMLRPERALAEMLRCAGSQFDPAIVEALERVLAASRTVLEQEAG